MCPIKDLSDSVRLPRLGKIHLGIRHPEKGYPMKTDYFVLPKDHSDYDKMVELYGKEPKELPILIPVEDEEQWASQYYKAYNQTYGLVCKGDGETAMRMADTKTGNLPSGKETEKVALIEMTCPGNECKEYQAKKCHEVMNLRFILPEVPGIGVWQIDTGSKNAILNINSSARLIQKAFGRISMIPLKLTLEEIVVNNPETNKKQKVFVMNLRTDVTMAQLADAAREQSKTFMIEGPDLEAQFGLEVEKNIEDLWPEESLPEEAIAKNKAKPKDKPVEQAATKQPAEPTKQVLHPEEGEGQPRSPIDLDWLGEQLDIMRSKKLAGWTNTKVCERLEAITGETASSVSEAVMHLNKEQAKKFAALVTDTVQMA